MCDLGTDDSIWTSSSHNLRNQTKNQNKYVLLHFLSVFVVGNGMQMQRMVQHWFEHVEEKKFQKKKMPVRQGTRY